MLSFLKRRISRYLRRFATLWQTGILTSAFNWKNIQKFGQRLTRLPKVLTFWDKIIIVCGLIFLILLWSSTRLDIWSHGVQPAYGGEIHEGIIATSSTDVDRDIETLVMAGLTRFDDQKRLLPYLAKSWVRSEDGKRYTFILHESLDAQLLVEHYKNRTDQLPGLTWLAQDKQTILIELREPYGLLLDNLTKPFFPYGPYKVVNRFGRTVELTANESFVLGKPFIPKITIHIYKDERQLSQALKRHELTGTLSETTQDASFGQYTLSLPRYIFLFFNVKKEPFQSKEVRQKLVDKKNLDSPISGTILTTIDDVQQKIANDLRVEWQLLGADFSLETFTAQEFKTKNLAEKNYQALIYGIDLGRDADEYLFWHSSQAGPNGQNISQFENPQVDKLLEEYRLTNDDAARGQKYEELKKILNEERPAVQLHQTQLSYQLSKKVKGVKINQGVTPADRFQNVWEWYINTQ